MKSQKQSSSPEARKKTYAKPGLRTHGNLAQITSKVGSKGQPDGGKGSKTKTRS